MQASSLDWIDIKVQSFLILLYCVCTVRPTQQTRFVEPLLFQCWASVGDDGQALKQQFSAVKNRAVVIESVRDTESFNLNEIGP